MRKQLTHGTSPSRPLPGVTGYAVKLVERYGQTPGAIGVLERASSMRAGEGAARYPTGQ